MKGVERFMARRPLALAVLCYCVGAAFGCASDVPAIIWSAGLILCAAMFLMHRHMIWLFCALALIGAWTCAALNQMPSPATGDGMLTGWVSGVPKVEEARATLTLEDAKLNGQALNTRLRLYVYGEAFTAEPGDLVNAQAKTWLPKGQTNPGGFDFAFWLRRGGVRLCATASAEETLVIPGAPGIEAWLSAARGDIAERLNRLYPNQGALASGMVLGDKSELPGDVYEQFRVAGVAHLLAVSGLHIGCLAAAACMALSAAGLGQKASYLVTLILCSGYALLVGMPASAARAVCMFALAGGGKCLGRPYDVLTGLAAAALLLLASNPLSIGDGGMILSFTAVLGMVLLGPPLANMLRVERWNGRLKRAGEMLALSGGAQLGTMPAVCCMFGQISLYAIFANLPAILLCSMAVPLMALSVLADMLWQPLGVLVAAPARLVLTILEGVIGWTAALPGAAIRAPAWPVALMALYAALALAASPYLAVREKLRKGAVAALILCPIIAMAISWLRIPDGLSLLFLDAGQGDAVVVTAQKRTYLVDVGEEGGPAAAYLRYTGRAADGVFLSHGHMDHAGGLMDVLSEGHVPVIYLPECWGSSEPDESVAQAVEAARERGTRIEYLARGDVVPLSGDVRVEVLYPERGQILTGNDSSLLLRVAYGEGAALLTGDLPSAREDQYIKRAILVKAAHHGSAGGTGEMLLRAASPAVCVISVGQNGYGHPSTALLSRLERLGVAVCRTDMSGAITARIGADGTLEMESFL